MKTRPVLRSLCMLTLLTSCLTVLDTPLPARDNDKILQSVSQLPDLDAIVASIFDRIPSARKRKKNRVVWIIDNESTMREERQLATLADAIDSVASRSPGTEHGLIVLGNDIHRQIEPTEDIEQLTKGIRRLAAKSENDYKNPMQAILLATNLLKSVRGHKAIVLFTLKNGDLENNVEHTLTALRRVGAELLVISHEAAFSDSYWLHQGINKGTVPKPMIPAGSDGAWEEVPTLWAFQDKDVEGGIASGYGPYGLSRLASASGGVYYPWAPPNTSRLSFCQAKSCAACNTKHTECYERYHPTLLQEIAPSLEARAKQIKGWSKDDLRIAIYTVWVETYKAGLTSAAPPILVGPNGLFLDKKGALARNRDPFYLKNDIKDLDRKSREALAVTDNLITFLKKAIKKTKKSKTTHRSRAIAETVLFQLEVTRFNLRQLELFVAYSKSGEQDNPEGAPWNENVFRRKEDGSQPFRYGMSHYYLCQKGKKLREVNLLGGQEDIKAKNVLADMADQLIDKYQGTPLALLMRRTAVIVFTPDFPPSKKEDGQRSISTRDRKKGKEEQGTTHSRTSRPSRTGKQTRSRRSRNNSSRSRSSGRTTTSGN